MVLPPLPELIRRIPPFRTAAVLAAIAGVVWALSSPEPPPYVNITQPEYNSALAKWQALHVREYKAIIAKEGYCNHGCVLHVRTDGRKTELADDTGPLDFFLISTFIPNTYLEGMTIEEMFDATGKLLPTAPVANPAASRQVQPRGMYYTVTFNPVMGYPQTIEARLFNDRFNLTQWLGVYNYAEENWSVHVKSLTVLAR